MPSFPCDYVFCADIGSIRKDNFGWASAAIDQNRQATSSKGSKDIQKLANEVGKRLKEGSKVALGFECPLWVPVYDTPEELTSSRCGDGSRPWSASAGAGSLATGLAEYNWILEKIRKKSPNSEAFLDWDSYKRSPKGLFLWEAFVSGVAKKHSHTGDAKEDPHIRDAKKAVCQFVQGLPSPEKLNAVHPASLTVSLIGAALLRTGWSKDLSLLHKPCIVIKA